MKRAVAKMNLKEITIAYGMTETSPVSFQSGTDDPLELRVATEVRQARLDMETAAANYRAAQTVLQSFEAAYDVVVLRVENQRSILLEQLDALAALTQARANLAEAVFDHSIAAARLQRAIGRP